MRSTEALTILTKLRGGSRPFLARCDDNRDYVVKLHDNPQGARILINELVCHELATRLALPIPNCALVLLNARIVFPEDLGSSSLSPSQRRSIKIAHFGSEFVVNPLKVPAYSFLPDAMMPLVDNTRQFLDVLVFDTWVGNKDSRQFVFFKNGNDGRFTSRMIDQGYCFGGASWELSDRVLGRPIGQRQVYDWVHSIDDMEPVFNRINNLVDNGFYDIIDQIPKEWLRGNLVSLRRLLVQLRKRAFRIPFLMRALADGPYTPFRYWETRRDHAECSTVSKSDISHPASPGTES